MGLVSLQSRAVLGYLYWKLRQPIQDDWIAKLTGQPISSNQASETYVGLGATHPMREFIGARKVQNLRPESYSITNVKYENTLRVLGDEIRRDKTGQVMLRVNDLVGRFQQHWYRLLSALIKAAEGTSLTCFDGQYYYDTDHASGASGSQSNDITSSASSTTAPTAAEAETAIWAAIAKVETFVDDAGEPSNMGVKDFVIMIPPAFRKAFAGALSAPIIQGSSAGISNILVSAGGYNFELVSNPYLATSIGGTAWTTKFALHAADGRSFIRQNELDLKISAKAEGSEYEHDWDAHEYGLMTIRAAGLGSWQSGVLVTFT